MTKTYESPSFASQKKAWASPPVDDVGYIPSKELLEMSDEQFGSLMDQMSVARYTGWRNYHNNWTRVLRLNSTVGQRVLDYGSGVGVEAIRYGVLGNKVWCADIVEDNLRVVERTFQYANVPLQGTLLISGRSPFLTPPEPLDVIHCSGVLHHIPDPTPIVKAMHGWLTEEGELRLMLYSDEAWRVATKTEPPEDDVSRYIEFDAFVRHWDAVGSWADWYDRAKLERLFGEWFTVEVCEPLTEYGTYIGAVLRKR